MNQHRGLEVHLSDPQALNSYSYALNNPMIIIDPTGELSLSDIGIAMSNSQRSVAKSFHNFAKSMEKYGPPAAGVAFVSDTLGSVSDNVANIYDPRKSSGERLLAFGLAVLDTSSGGKGSGAKLTAKEVLGAWKNTNMNSTYQTVKYHLREHGLGRTLSEYTKDGIDFFNSYKDRGKDILLKNGETGVKIKVPEVNYYGIYDKTGKQVTHGPIKENKSFLQYIQ